MSRWDGERVVITGLGILAANGIGKQEFWSSLLAGRSGIGRVTLCDVTGLDSQIAGEVKGFDPKRFVKPGTNVRHMTRTSQLAVAAARLAVEDSGLTRSELERDPPALVCVGVCLGGFDFIEREIRRIAAHGLPSMLPSVIGCVNVHPGKHIIRELDLNARLATFSGSCSAGIEALSFSARAIRTRKATLVIAGGVDAPIVSCLMSGFCAARMLSTQNAQPEKASRPFDALRDRGVLAEGAAFVVMETLSRARARGARVYAEVLGSGAATDDPTTPLSGLREAIELAVAETGLLPRDIDWINAHGASDQNIDRWEVDQIKRVFGSRSREIPTTSIKGVTGNPVTAAGPMQVVATALGLSEGWVPPIANYEVPDPRCDLRFVTARPWRLRPRIALVNAHGMGGVNAAMILGAVGAE